MFLLSAAVANAATPRQTLLSAAYQARDKPTALEKIGEAEAQADAVLRGAPGDREARMIKAMADGYRAKLNRSRSHAVDARKSFEALAAADPRDPEAQAAIGAWHIDAVSELGGFIAGTMLGASRTTGLAAMDRAVSMGGDRAMFPGLAALLRLSLDAKDVQVLALAERAAGAATPTALDRVMQRAASALLPKLRAGDRRGAQAMARQLLPFGSIAK